MTFIYTPKNILRGTLIYSSGDTVAALLTGDFSWQRWLAVAIAGATFYAFEIPNYFQWIERRTAHLQGMKAALVKTALALVYFNPLWIARHMAIIRLASPGGEPPGWDLISIAGWSFLVNIPVSFAANYLIQNLIMLRWRFVASAVFSALMAIYYALSLLLFR
jgi:hypothetical protein